MDCSMSGFPIHHQFLELAQTHVHWVGDEEKVKTVTDFIFLSSKTPEDGDYSHKIKRHLLLGRKASKLSVIKRRGITFPTKVHKSQSYDFSNSHVQMWELDRKEGWMLKKWCFWTMVLEKTLESPSDSKEIKPVNPKGNQPRIFTGRTLLKLQYFDHLMQRTNSLEKTLMLGKIKGKKIRGQQRMKWLDSITNSMNLNLSNSRR